MYFLSRRDEGAWLEKSDNRSIELKSKYEANTNNIFDKTLSSTSINARPKTLGVLPMSNLQPLTDALESAMTLADQVRWLEQKIITLETELRKLTHNGWMSLAEASEHIPGKTVSALRQRIKNPKKPMPEGVVWRQEAKGHEIQIHLGNYRKYA